MCSRLEFGAKAARAFSRVITEQRHDWRFSVSIATPTVQRRCQVWTTHLPRRHEDKRTTKVYAEKCRQLDLKHFLSLQLTVLKIAINLASRLNLNAIEFSVFLEGNFINSNPRVLLRFHLGWCIDRRKRRWRSGWGKRRQ